MCSEKATEQTAISAFRLTVTINLSNNPDTN